MSLGISSTSSAINEANLRRRQLRNLGVFTQDDEKAFGPELSAIAANERGDLARFGAAFASAKAEGARAQLEAGRLTLADRRQKELVEAQKTKDIMSQAQENGLFQQSQEQLSKDAWNIITQLNKRMTQAEQDIQELKKFSVGQKEKNIN